jgi:hypothetical protein
MKTVVSVVACAIAVSACTALPEARFVRADFTQGDVTYVARPAQDLPADVLNQLRRVTNDEVAGWYIGGDRLEVLTASRTDDVCGGSVYNFTKASDGYELDPSSPELEWMCHRL